MQINHHYVYAGNGCKIVINRDIIDKTVKSTRGGDWLRRLAGGSLSIPAG